MNEMVDCSIKFNSSLVVDNSHLYFMCEGTDLTVIDYSTDTSRDLWCFFLSLSPSPQPPPPSSSFYHRNFSIMWF